MLDTSTQPQFNPDDRNQRLAALGPGLTMELIREAVSRASSSANTVSALTPPSYEGTTLHAEAVANLTDLLIEHGWRQVVIQGFCTVVSPDGRTQIAVATGNSRTGRDPAEGMPKTANPRGTRTELAIEQNQQPTLWEVSEGEPEVTRSITYFLLVRRNGREICVELARPDGQAQDGRVNSFSDRIPIDPVNGEATMTMFDGDDDTGDDGIDFEVERRKE